MSVAAVVALAIVLFAALFDAALTRLVRDSETPLLGWMALIWAGSVLALGAAAYLIRLWLNAG